MFGDATWYNVIWHPMSVWGSLLYRGLIVVVFYYYYSFLAFHIHLYILSTDHSDCDCSCCECQWQPSIIWQEQVYTWHKWGERILLFNICPSRTYFIWLLIQVNVLLGKIMITYIVSEVGQLAHHFLKLLSKWACCHSSPF